MVERLFLAVPWGCLRFVIVVFPDHTHLLFFKGIPVRLFLKLLFTLIIPILTYSSESWISDFKIHLFDNSNQFEKKSILEIANTLYILGIDRKTSNFCKCDLEIFLISNVILKQVFSYYQRLQKLPAKRFLKAFFLQIKNYTFVEVK